MWEKGACNPKDGEVAGLPWTRAGSWSGRWPAGREMQAETSKQEGPLPSQGIGWSTYRTHLEPTGGGASIPCIQCGEWLWTSLPGATVSHTAGERRRIKWKHPGTRKEAPSSSASYQQSLTQGRSKGGMPTGPAPSLQSRQWGQVLGYRGSPPTAGTGIT